MEAKAIIFYRNALAVYSVTSEDRHGFTAQLVEYKGEQKNSPPLTIKFSKHGRHCFGSTDNQDLMDDICDAVQAQISGEANYSFLQPFYPPHPMSLYKSY